MRNYRQTLLDPTDCVIVILDHQPQMYFGVESKSRSIVLNAVKGLANTAKLFQVPVVLTTITAETFSGYIYEEIQKVFPDLQPIDRSTLNAWEDQRVKRAITDVKRKKIIIAGLWTEVCVTFPALSAIYDGYEVFIVEDACGGVSKEAHYAAIDRMKQKGVVPITWLALLLEFQRDWADKTTYEGTNAIIQECGGAYGVAIKYKEDMLEN